VQQRDRRWGRRRLRGRTEGFGRSSLVVEEVGRIGPFRPGDGEVGCRI